MTGEHCRFCGDKYFNLKKTPCCNEWICSEPKDPKYRGPGRCEDMHEKYSLCKSQFDDRHPGNFSDCQECVRFWGEDYENMINRPVNYPKFKTPNGEIKADIARIRNSCW